MNPYRANDTCQIKGLDDIYRKYFGNKLDGSFVEVGAYDGYTYSNTAHLAEVGWKGVYVEPIPEYAQLCRDRHLGRNVEVIEALAGMSTGEDKMINAGALSTSGRYLSASLKVFRAMDNGEGIAKLENGTELIVRERPLNDILRYTSTKANFDLLVIDVEGMEWEVLQGFDLAYWLPRMIIIEMHEQSEAWNGLASIREQNHKLNEYFAKNKYKKIYSDDINTIFIYEP